FTEPQRQIYQLVLDAQEAGIKACVDGAAFGAGHRAASDVMAAGLVKLGVIKAPNELGRYFMHGTSHSLGLDVHDAMPTDSTLRPGAVLTVEPGIYISEGSPCDPKWWNIGVRIEDDILVTAKGPVNLSAEAPRTIKDVEAMMRSGRK
ncbi:MAG: M24 family metallopeptidase, partial [Chthonomonadaceae bacterium]|nr:M24 family metallopeptidase [Chthonomonadaceae bacterium]